MVPRDVQMSFQHAEKGSYRQDNILKYLSRWLDPWTPEREASSDYRLLYLDMAKSHLSNEVVEFAWSRRYIVLFHYGCTTGICQVNDTDLHCLFELNYLELEQASFNRQQMLDPGYIGRSLQQVVDDVAATWRSLDHNLAVLGHKRVGLSNRLDGTEDDAITREARIFWDCCGMVEARPQAISEVDRLFDEGSLQSMASWKALVTHPAEAGVKEAEGAEFEGELEAGEALWWEDGEEEKRALALDDVEEKDLDLVDAPPVELEPGAARPADPVNEVEAATISARRLANLKRLRAGIRASKVPQAEHHLDQQICHLERGLRGKDGPAQAVNGVLRRHVDAALLRELKEAKDKQDEALLQARNRRLVKARLAKTKAQKQAAAKAAEEVKKLFDDLPVNFTPDDCGAKGARGLRLRIDCLERLKLRAPELGFAENARWPDVRDRWAAHMPNLYSGLGAGALGSRFVMRVNAVLEALGRHYAGPSSWAGASSKLSDRDAFLKFFNAMESQLPKGGLKIIL